MSCLFKPTKVDSEKDCDDNAFSSHDVRLCIGENNSNLGKKKEERFINYIREAIFIYILF